MISSFRRNGSSANQTVSANLAAGYNLTKTGLGVLTLSGTNSHSSTKIVAGTIAFAAAAALASGAIELAGGTLKATAGNLTVANAISVTASSKIDCTAQTVAETLTLSGVLSGSAALEYASSGDLGDTGGSAGLGVDLTNASNTYSGPVTVSSGLISRTATSLITTDGITLNGGGIVDPNRSLTIANAIVIGASNAYFRVWGSATLKMTGNISGTGAIYKTDAGELDLKGTNTYSGGTNIRDTGFVRIKSTGGLGTGAVAAIASCTIATTSDASASTLSNAFSITSGKTLSFDGGYAAITASGVISGAGAVRASGGGGTVTLSGNNTYSGGVSIVSGGYLDFSFASASDTPQGSGTITFNSDNAQIAFVYSGALTVANNIVIYSGGWSNLWISGGTHTVNFTGVISGGNTSSGIWFDTGSADGNSVFKLSGSNTFVTNTGYTGANTTINRGRLQVNHANAMGNSANSWELYSYDNTTLGQLDFQVAGTFANPIFMSWNDTTINNNANSVTLSGVITEAGYKMRKIGSGVLTLSGNSSAWDDGANILVGGVLVANNNGLGTGPITLGQSGSASYIELDNGITTSNSLTFAANSGTTGRGSLRVSGANNASWGGAITVNATPTIGGHFSGGDTGGVLTIGGTLASSATIRQRKNTVIYSGGGTATNTFDVTGTMKPGADNGIPVGVSITLGYAEPATLDLNGYNQEIAGLTDGANSATVTNSGSAKNLTINVASGTKTYDDVIDGGANVNIIKSGAGTQAFTGANTYTGTTAINAGVLSIGDAAGLGTGTVDANSGGTLTYTVDTTGTRTVNANTGGTVNKGGFTHTGTTFNSNGGTINA